jgi:hypothetical protein
MRLPSSADKGRFKKSLSMSGEVGSLVGDFRMSDPDRLTSHDKAFDRDTQGFILRIIVVAFLAALFWQAISLLECCDGRWRV